MEKGMTLSVVMNEELKEVLLEELKNQTEQIIEEYRNNLDFQYVKKKELAKSLSVSEQTINKWMNTGLPYIQLDSVILFNLIEVKTWLTTFRRGEEL